MAIELSSAGAYYIIVGGWVILNLPAASTAERFQNLRIVMMLRFFCVVAPGAAGDIPAGYLEAFAATGIRIRALPIGPASARTSNP